MDRSAVTTRIRISCSVSFRRTAMKMPLFYVLAAIGAAAGLSLAACGSSEGSIASGGGGGGDGGRGVGGEEQTSGTAGSNSNGSGGSGGDPTSGTAGGPSAGGGGSDPVGAPPTIAIYHPGDSSV